jgi:hypothetical protein
MLNYSNSRLPVIARPLQGGKAPFPQGIPGTPVLLQRYEKEEE